MTTLFRNLQQTSNYAKFRPVYPAALYEFLVDRLRVAPTLAVDVGCGTGQATWALARHFDQVIGIDPSAEQLSQIDQQCNHQDDDDGTTMRGKVSFQVADSVQGLAALPAQSVSCITAAQAAHWFDLPAFYNQVDRVLQPGGILALWTYGLVQYDRSDVDQLVNQWLYRDVLDGYWDDRRLLVEQQYATLPLMQVPGYTTHRVQGDFDMALECSGTELAGYLRSWSGYQAYCAAHDIAAYSDADPVQKVEEFLVRNDIGVIGGKWPVTILWSQKQPPRKS